MRLSLEPKGSARGSLDGAWWPRSRDAGRELTGLISALGAHGCQVLRIGLNHAAWDSHPERMTAGGRVVKLSWYGVRDVNTMTVSGANPNHLDLLVVPPDAGAAAAEAAMAAAIGASRAGATDVLTAHGIRTGVTPRCADGVLAGPSSMERIRVEGQRR